MVKTREQIERAYGVLDVIEAHPESHDQNWWIMGLPVDVEDTYTAAKVLNVCGTTACVAGWTVLLAGGEVHNLSYVEMPDGKFNFIRDAARGLLGLDDEEEHALFHVAEDLADVRKAIFDIFGPRPDGV